MNEQLAKFSKDYGFGYINKNISEQLDIKKEILDIFQPQIAQKYKMLPWQITEDNDAEKTLTILTSNTEAIKFQTEILSFSDTYNKIDFFMVAEKPLMEAINSFYNLMPTTDVYDEENKIQLVEAVTTSEEENEEDNDLERFANDNSSPIVALVNTIIRTAVMKKASDIHFEPEESGMIVKFRLDGILIPQRNYTIPEKSKKAVIARLKVLSNLKITQKREAQDGQIKLKINGVDIDFRVSIIPAINGEKAVLRILDKTTSLLELEKLGFENNDIKIFNKIIRKPTGIILITGPTGSGKSTTLYSFLNRLDSTSKNITTVENPVEYQLKGINQIQINEGHISFADALRAILRQDPNIIMIGEIRDQETAEEAVQASQTGHLVFSTLHTNDSISAINRLKRLGIEEDSISQTLTCVIAQRLVRKICPNCMEEYTPDFETLGTKNKDIEFLTANGHKLVHGKGCEKCDFTGYKDRTTVYEFFLMNDEIRKMIETGKNIYEVKEYLRKDEKMLSMWEKALKLVKNNTTTIEEITNEVMES